MHQNTVTYRVKRAEELMGRRVNHNPVELVCALTLAAALGAPCWPTRSPPAEPAQPLVARSQRAELRRLRP